MTPFRPATADETLHELEARAWELEAANRYDTVDRRTVRHTIDGVSTDVLGPPRIALLVVAAYPKFMEQQAFYGHANIGRRYDVKAHLAYVVEYEGVPLPLRGRKQALEVLETGELPRGVVAPVRVEPAVMSDDECDALFADIARRSMTAAQLGIRG